MKQLSKIVLPIVMLIATYSITSCTNNDDVIWDITPVEIYIEVVNSEGYNLIDPKSEYTIINKGITATFMNQNYKLYNIEDFYKKTRAYMPIPYGLVFKQDDYSKQYLIYFGQFDGTENYSKESLIIDWNDGTKNEIIIDHHFKWRKGTPKIKEQIWLDNTKASRKIRIVKN